MQIKNITKITLLALILNSQTLFAIPSFDKMQVKSDKPINIEADKLYYDRNKDIVYAIGDVYLKQDNQSIIADRILFYKTTDDIYAEDNVAIHREDGSIYFADKVKLNRVSNKAIILNFKGRLGPQGLLASNFAKVINDNVVELNNVVYSPCKVCEDNLVANQPIWQIRASKATINNEDEKIYYNHARLEGFGVPFFYLPYLSTPIPGANRRSGLLTPKYSYSREFGNTLKIPYYLNIAPNFDATYAPTFIQKEEFSHTKKEVLHELQLRHLFKYGQHEVKFFVIETNKIGKSGELLPGKHELRGFYNYAGEFTFKEKIINGILSIDSKRLHDPTQTFAKKYKINQEDILKTDVNLRDNSNNYYYQVRGLSFQDLRPGANQKTTPSALPNLGFYYEQSVTNYKLKNSIELNYLNIDRPQGSSYQRIIGIGALEKSNIIGRGFLLKTKGSLRGDLYRSTYNDIIVKSSYRPQHPQRRGEESRWYPEGMAEFSWPLLSKIEGFNIVIEPVIMAITAPNAKKLKIADNEDSQDPEISAANLFSPNRYKGFDLLESGNRLNYGIKANVNSTWFHNLNFIFGQNYRFKRDPNFTSTSGLDGLKSDYVTKVSFQPTKNIFLNDAIRFSDKDFKILRHEASMTLGYPSYSATLNYSAVNGRILDNSKANFQRQEIILSGSYNFYGRWWADAGFTRKLGKKRSAHKTPMIADNFALRHVTECLNTTVSVARDYTRLKDLTPSTTYVFKIEIPTF